MKKIYSLLLPLVALAALSSCKNEVDDIFDQSSSARIEEAIQSCNNVLTAAPNGWVMTYKGASQYGCYNVLCKFNTDSTVNITNELGTASAGTHYSLKQSQGVLLSFDEYNKAIHTFSDPVADVGDRGKGFEGDLEFRVQKASADSVVLLGKKHEDRIIMTPIPANITWIQYLQAIKTTKNNMAAPKYRLILNGDTLTAQCKYHTLIASDNVGNQTILPFVYTPDGLRLYQPMVVKSPKHPDGTIVTGFTYKGDTICNDVTDTNIKLIQVFRVADSFIEGIWSYVPSLNVSSAAAVAWTHANTTTQSVGFTVVYAFMGYSEGTFTLNVAIRSGGTYIGEMYFEVVATSKDEITLAYTGKANANGSFMYKSLGWGPFIEQLGTADKPRKFRITANDIKAPTRITLTDESDATNVIVFANGVVPLSSSN